MTTTPRRQARVIALQALYEADTSTHPVTAVVERLIEEQSPPQAVADFARLLVQGVAAQRPAIDAEIARSAPLWPVAEIATIDRNVLRLAIYEVLFDTKAPVRAAVNEAVELAKSFGSDNSSKFINGVLGAVAARATR